MLDQPSSNTASIPLRTCLLLIIGGLLVCIISKSVGRSAAVAVLWIVTAVTVKNSFIHVANELADEPHSGYAHQTIPDGLKIFHDRYPAVQSFSVLIPPASGRFAHHLDELAFYRTIYRHYEGKTVQVSDQLTGLRAGDTLICNRETLGQLETARRVVRLDSTAGGAMWIVPGAAYGAASQRQNEYSISPEAPFPEQEN